MVFLKIITAVQRARTVLHARDNLFMIILIFDYNLICKVFTIECYEI